MAGVVCLAFAAVVGGATGFGTALVATPLMLLVGMDVATVVVVNLVAGLITRVVVAVRMRQHMDRRRVRMLCLGSIPGALAGALLVAYLPEDLLKPAAGVAIMACGVWLALPRRAEPRELSVTAQAATGAVGGFLTSTTSLGGPPPVLLLQQARVPPSTFIADLAGYFVVTNSFSLVVLLLNGAAPSRLPLLVVPAFVAAASLGNSVGLRLARLMPAAVFRAVVIALVIAAGAATLVPA
ncbi:sulfite exporter TauE/SafE family protein [Nocardia sp. MDA0666]|uniref:sulfite exporter TauE/SafE family protein n=1 Tax=Nocardia sp. MDA0666 TaxID=2135448 RepID=UPI001E6271BB|nr:sulfite exporter TauE/SafE family protein [Nocardia sp. MDA0666]